MLVEVSKPSQWNQSMYTNADQLWSGMRNGDEKALSTLFCAFYPQLFNYGAKIVPREAFIKDCIQELFLILWDKRNNINEAHSVKSYLFHSFRRIILRNLAKQKSRSQRNQTYVDNYFEETYNIEELMIHFETENEKKKEFFRAIDSLGSRQKKAVCLKFYGGLSNSEIAHVMGIKQQSVYNHVSKAISKLQEFMQR